MRHWFHILARRILPSTRPRPSRRSARRAVTLGVETLEHRTLMAVLPAFFPAAAPVPIAAQAASANPPGGAPVEPATADEFALNQLLNDLRQLNSAPQTAGFAGLGADMGAVGVASSIDTSTPDTFDESVHIAPMVSPASPAQVAPRAVVAPPTDPVQVSTPPPVSTATRVIAMPTVPAPAAVPAPAPSAAPAERDTETVTVTAPEVHTGAAPSVLPAPASGPFSTTAAQALLPDGAPAVALTTPVPQPAVHDTDTDTEPVAAPAESVASPSAAIPDGVLLQRFATAHDQEAFDILARRYEPLVLNICRRVLGDAHVAEDARQATFLILARKAATLDPMRPLAGWLYMVAYHLSLRLRAIAARRRRSDLQAARGRPTEVGDVSTVELETREVHQVLREELQQLPDPYRVPLTLCYFAGQTHAQVAQAIGMPRGSIAKRIGEGLALLRERLLHRGISL
jgi:RNA polymerase sigma factor (sigma-70 family)